jgi:hypothetical protein
VCKVTGLITSTLNDFFIGINDRIEVFDEWLEFSRKRTDDACAITFAQRFE